SSYDSHFNRAGVTFFASSGDDGAGVSWPAASPYVVSVGGTTLLLDAAGNVSSETAWSGSGGGISFYLAPPGFPAGWETAPGPAVPAVSYNADPNPGVPVCIGNYNNQSGWITVGGTSAGAPQWAALWALVNASRGPSLGSANTVLYSFPKANYNQYFRDVVVG